jgi:type II secretory pathway pseudopilin PulG
VTAAPGMPAVRDERGLSLIELVVVMPMLVVLLGGLTTTLITLVHWNDQTREETMQLGESRAAINALVTELRQSYPVDPGTGIQSPIATATATSVTFFTPDRTTTSGTNGFRLRKVAYDFSNNQLRRQAVTSSAQYVIGGTTPPNWNFPGTFPTSTGWVRVLGPPDGSPVTGSLTYYDANGTALSAPVSSTNLIVRIAVTVNASSTPGGKGITTYKGSVAIRENQS